jgi:hypothetical protein
MGHLNREFEQVGLPYAPRLEPGSKASKEAAKKKKDDVGAGLAGKHAKVSGRKVMAPKAFAALRGSGTVLSEVALKKAAPTPPAKSAPKASALSRGSAPSKASALPKDGAPLRLEAAMKATVLKSALMVATSKAGVLWISTRMKSPSVDSLQAPKGKQARVDMPPHLFFTPTPKAVTWLRPPTESDDGQVAYCLMLDFVPSAESCSSLSSSDSSELASIIASPPPVPDMVISAELPDILEMPEVEAA